MSEDEDVERLAAEIWVTREVSIDDARKLAASLLRAPDEEAPENAMRQMVNDAAENGRALALIPAEVRELRAALLRAPRETPEEGGDAEMLSWLEAAEDRLAELADETSGGQRENLRTCPFCGRDAYLWTDSALVRCADCGVEVHGDCPEQAVAAWNRRIAGQQDARHFADGAPSWEGEPRTSDVVAEIAAVAAECGASVDQRAMLAFHRIADALRAPTQTDGDRGPHADEMNLAAREVRHRLSEPRPDPAPEGARRVAVERDERASQPEPAKGKLVGYWTEELDGSHSIAFVADITHRAVRARHPLYTRPAPTQTDWWVEDYDAHIRERAARAAQDGANE